MFSRSFAVRLGLLSRINSQSYFLCSSTLATKSKLYDGPGLEHFIANSRPKKAVSVAERNQKRRTPEDAHPYLSEEMMRGEGLSVYLDVHGCQMNVNDTEVVWSILEKKGYKRTMNSREADVWLIVTCSIREGAENKIWKKLRRLNASKRNGSLRQTMKIGLLGCMAERLKESLLETNERLVDIVAGPDSYKDLPRLLTLVTNSSMMEDQTSAINVLLSVDETYADVVPSRLNKDSVTGFVSIQRGCDNMCSYCIVPFTRGVERSRPVETVVREVQYLVDQGVKEITLLGQNVNSYRDTSVQTHPVLTKNTEGFKSIYKPKVGGMRFADLLQKVSEVDPETRIRFTSPHPKDFPDEVLQMIAVTPNICNNLHLPAQSGSTKVLRDMRRGYTREAYLSLVDRVRSVIPNVTISGDMIAGFCGETDEEFEETLSLIREVKYTFLYFFPYSLREKTHAHRSLVDDVPEKIKMERFSKMGEAFREEAHRMNQKLIGSHQLVLAEGPSKRSGQDFQGRSDGYIKVIFPKVFNETKEVKPGNYCVVEIDDASSQVLKGRLVDPSTTLQEFYNQRDRLKGSV